LENNLLKENTAFHSIKSSFIVNDIKDSEAKNVIKKLVSKIKSVIYILKYLFSLKKI